jgi:hypothetical protein
MRPAIEPLPVRAARAFLLGVVTAIVWSLILHACACGAPFSLAPDAGELAIPSSGDDDAAGDLIPDAPSAPAADGAAGDEPLEIARGIVDAGDAGELIPDAPTPPAGDAGDEPPVLEHGCSASTECPVCPGTPVMYGCCHAGACGCVGLGEACSP